MQSISPPEYKSIFGMDFFENVKIVGSKNVI